MYGDFHMMTGRNEWTSQLMRRLKWYQQHGILCDTTLVADNGEEILAHSCVLAAASKSLRMMLILDKGTHTVETALTGNSLREIIEAVYSEDYLTGKQDPFGSGQSSKPQGNSCTILNWLLRDQKYGGQFCDTALISTSSKRKPTQHAHSAVLVAASPVMYRLLTESPYPAGCYRIDLNAMKFDSHFPLVSLVVFLYTGTGGPICPKGLLMNLGIQLQNVPKKDFVLGGRERKSLRPARAEPTKNARRKASRSMVSRDATPEVHAPIVVGLKPIKPRLVNMPVKPPVQSLTPSQVKIVPSKVSVAVGTTEAHKQPDTWEQPLENAPSFRCGFCACVFPTYSLLEMHNNIIHSKRLRDGRSRLPTVHTCQFCLMPFDRKLALKRHLEKSHGIVMDDEAGPTLPPPIPVNVIKCSFCVEVFNLKSQRDHHWRLEHGFTGNSHLCTGCSEIFPTKSDLIEHSQVHGRKVTMLHCNVCGEDKFRTKRQLRDHSRTHYRRRKRYKKDCDYCSKPAVYFDSVRHMCAEHRILPNSSHSAGDEAGGMCNENAGEASDKHLSNPVFPDFVEHKDMGYEDLSHDADSETAITPCSVCGRQFTTREQLGEHTCFPVHEEEEKRYEKDFPDFQKHNLVQDPSREAVCNRQSPGLQIASMASLQQGVERVLTTVSGIPNDVQLPETEIKQEPMDAGYDQFDSDEPKDYFKQESSPLLPCFLCAEAFPRQNQLEMHILEEHSCHSKQNNSMKTNQEEPELPNNALPAVEANEAAKEEETTPIQCGYCDKQFEPTDRILWEVHIKKEHKTHRIHKCLYCPMAFTDTNSGLAAKTRHESIHKNTGACTPDSGYQMKQIRRLATTSMVPSPTNVSEAPVEYMSPDAPDVQSFLQCGHCDKTFDFENKILWEMHIKKTHSSHVHSKVRCCDYCPMGFASLDQRSQHELGHMCTEPDHVKSTQANGHEICVACTKSTNNGQKGMAPKTQAQVKPKMQPQVKMVLRDRRKRPPKKASKWIAEREANADSDYEPPLHIIEVGYQHQDADVEQEFAQMPTKDSVYQCNECGKSFDPDSVILLEMHLKREHDATRFYKCGLCHIGFSTRKLLAVHEKSRRHNLFVSYSSKKPVPPRRPAETTAKSTARDMPTMQQSQFSCGHCLRTFELEDKPLWEMHIKKAHNAKKVYSCRFCGTGFITADLSRLHEESHSQGCWSVADGNQPSSSSAPTTIPIKQEPLDEYQSDVPVQLPIEPDSIVKLEEPRSPAAAEPTRDCQQPGTSATARKTIDCSYCDTHFSSRSVLDVHTQTYHMSRDNEVLPHKCLFCRQCFLTVKLINKHQLHCYWDQICEAERDGSLPIVLVKDPTATTTTTTSARPLPERLPIPAATPAVNQGPSVHTRPRIVKHKVDIDENLSTKKRLKTTASSTTIVATHSTAVPSSLSSSAQPKHSSSTSTIPDNTLSSSLAEQTPSISTSTTMLARPSASTAAGVKPSSADSREQAKARLDALYSQFVEDAKEMCRICGQQFSSKDKLEEHTKLQHRRHQAFFCEQCARSFPTRVELLTHEMRYHELETGLTEEDENARYACGYCAESFSSSLGRDVHRMKKHTQRAYRCSWCLEKFMSWRERNRHESECHKSATVRQ